MLDGMFSFVVLDTRTNSFLVARVRGGGRRRQAAELPGGPTRCAMGTGGSKLSHGAERVGLMLLRRLVGPWRPVLQDPIGITSLYIGWGRDGSVWVASEMKCLVNDCVK